MSQPTTSFGQSSFINHEQGLVQLNGNQALYSKLLSMFGVQLTQDYADLVPDLEALLKTSNIEQAQWQKLQQLNHALKGVAGNLAIDGLFKLSQQIDLLLKQQQVPSASLIAQFAETFEATRAQLTTRVESVPISHAASDRTISVSEMDSLLVRVKNSEYIDDAELAELSAKIPKKHHQAWLVFQQYLDAFEFEKAAEALAGIID
jgi:HPt (histidine-containing phosphotransfer) domain-containing protein